MHHFHGDGGHGPDHDEHDHDHHHQGRGRGVIPDRETGRHAIRDPHHGGQGRHSQAEPWQTDPNAPLSDDPELSHVEVSHAGRSSRDAAHGPAAGSGPLLHLDCSLGVSGDMLLAALAHAGDLFEPLREALSTLPLGSFRLEHEVRRVAGLATRHIEVVQTKDQPLRHLPELIAVVEGSGLSAGVKAGARAVFTLLGQAEAKAHGMPLEQVHFHEIGAVDTIVDVAGVLWLAEALAPARITCSPVNLGSGFVRMAHGTLPVPAPAVAELACGVPVFSTELGMEAATPTGLALIRHLAQDFGTLPLGRMKAVGVGSGGRSSDERPTFLRAFLLEALG